MRAKREERLKKWITSDMELTAMYVMFAGLVLLPAVLRTLVLKESLGDYASINFPYITGVSILLIVKACNHGYTKSDWGMLLMWAFCAALMFYANYEQTPGKSWTCFFNLLFPIVLMLYHFEEDSFSRFMKHFIIVFDVLMILYFVLAVEEYFNSHAFLAAVYSVFPASNYGSFLERIQILNRFFSPWGHALYNAVYFSVFFILNDIYFHCRGKKYPKILFFFIAFAGCCLCAAKTSVVLLLIYMLISCIYDWRYKKSNKWMLAGMLAGAVLMLAAVYASGIMDSILVRFSVMLQNTPDRIEDFIRYFHTGVYPLRWLKGYGSRFVWKNMNDLRSGFEFPLMTEALHFGILFSVLVLIGWYLYVSVHMLRKRRYLCWAGFTAMYIQISCFDGIARENQDVFSWMCLFSMVMLNCAISIPGEGLVPIEEEVDGQEDAEQGVAESDDTEDAGNTEAEGVEADTELKETEPEGVEQEDVKSEETRNTDGKIRQKLHHIWNYYKLLIILGIFVLAAGVIIAYEIVNPGAEMICNVMLADVDAYGTDDDVFAQYLDENGYDTDDYKVKLTFIDSEEYTSKQIAEEVLAEEADLIIADESVIKNLQARGVLACLDDLIDLGELLEYDTDYYTSKDEDGNGHVYAIRLPEGNEIVYDGYYSDNVWIAIVDNSSNEHTAVSMLEYLMTVQDHVIFDFDSSEWLEYLEEMSDERE